MKPHRIALKVAITSWTAKSKVGMDRPTAISKWECIQAQYYKLSRALHRSKMSETELLLATRDMKMALVEKAQQLQAAHATILEDNHTIVSLRHDLERANARFNPNDFEPSLHTRFLTAAYDHQI